MSDEAERQRRLVASLLAARADIEGLPLRESGARALRGLRAYRANADASAARAMASAFPTVQMLIGEEDFAQLAREFWRAAPPLRGDLGEWGGGLADWIASHAQLAAWPYLADCARLDWALHRCERAADAAIDHDSFARLADADPSRLAIATMPGLALVESPWPVVLIHEVHHASVPADDAAFEALRDAIEESRGEAGIVSRRGWKGVVTRVDAATAAWTRELLAGADLAQALQRAQPGFDFGTWLAIALRNDWLKGIRVLRD